LGALYVNHIRNFLPFFTHIPRNLTHLAHSPPSSPPPPAPRLYPRLRQALGQTWSSVHIRYWAILPSYQKCPRLDLEALIPLNLPVPKHLSVGPPGTTVGRITRFDNPP
jgi:hypothetical protein